MTAYTRNMKLVWLGMGGRGRGEERCQVSSHYGMNWHRNQNLPNNQLKIVEYSN